MLAPLYLNYKGWLHELHTGELGLNISKC